MNRIFDRELHSLQLLAIQGERKEANAERGA
jgi:hypothetical protein